MNPTRDELLVVAAHAIGATMPGVAGWSITKIRSLGSGEYEAEYEDVGFDGVLLKVAGARRKSKRKKITFRMNDPAAMP